MDFGEVGWGDVDWIGLAQDSKGGELLWIRKWTFGFHKMLGIYRVAPQLVASRVLLSSIELVRKDNDSKIWSVSFFGWGGGGGRDSYSVGSLEKS
jgi:hypothetical protein